jgi:predicted RNase H-like nuclease (RuvC/YqgF family)
MKIKQGSMLTIVAVLSLWGTTLSSSLMAQDSSSDVSGSNDTTEQIELTRSTVQTERQSIVSEAMELTEEESKEFWPLYEQYRSEVNQLNDQLLKIIEDYAASYRNQNLTDEQARQMLSDYLELEEQKLEIQKKYVKKFDQVLPAKKVTRYFQLENKMDAVVNFGLAGSIPLVQ